MTRRPTSVTTLLAGVLLAGACVAPGPTGRTELTIYAAASLRGVLEEVERVYETEQPAVDLVVSTDSSAALATQIREGAPADLFLSADLTNPQALVEAGLAETVVPFAANGLTVIVPAGDPAAITTPADLARPGVRIIAAGDEVPITRYAGELVDALAALPGYPADFASAYAANVVSREDNVAAVVTKIELGEGDAAVVYATDAARADVEVVPVPPEADVRALYGGAVIDAGDQAPAARALLEWLAAGDGQALLVRSGFRPPAG